MAVTSTTLLVGDTGTGKSALLATLAEWGWKTHKKVSLLYSIDGGGFPTHLDALIRAGIVRVWKLRTRGEAFETCSRACQGQWPTEFLDPITGEVPPGVTLLPSITSIFTLTCGYCDAEVAQRAARKAFNHTIKCPKCKKQVNLQTGTISEKSSRPDFFKDVGLMFYDGLTSMQDWVMEDMAQKVGTGELKGEGTALGGKIVSGEITVGANNRSHYGFAQNRAAVWIQDASNISGLIIGPVFTARQQRATDSNTSLRIYGPSIAGQAKAAEVPAWVANCLGTTIVLDEKRRKEYRLYLTEYREEDNIPHLCKTRAFPGTMPDYLSDGPIDPESGLPIEGLPFNTFNLGYFQDLLERATKKTLAATAAAYPDAPGLQPVVIEQGIKEEIKKVKSTKPVPKVAVKKSGHKPPMRVPGKAVAKKPIPPRPTQRLVTKRANKQSEVTSK